MIACLLGGSLAGPGLASDRLAPLKEAVVVQNQADLRRSLLDGSYRGEEGILRLKPEVAESFGMTVFKDPYYLEAKEKFQQADAYLDQAKAAMVTRDSEPVPGTHARSIAENYLRYTRSLAEAKAKIALYHATLAGKPDDRLQNRLNEKVLNRLVVESLEKAENRLRDALGYVYNATRGIPDSEAALTSENVEFVNEVFNRITKEAPRQSLSGLDLDRVEDFRLVTDRDWSCALPAAFPYTSFIQETRTKFQDCETDPLLFLALIRRESNFDACAVSAAGAAGLTQIMPGTALDMGVKTVYVPDYLAEAGSLLEEERKARGQAAEALHSICDGEPLSSAAKARDAMQRALNLAQQRERLYGRYRKELLESRADDRFNPSVSIEVGYRFFCALLKEHGGDVSLALAAYNAGSSRVKEYKGIPPFGETVRFRNRVLEYYRDYLCRLRAPRNARSSEP